MFKGLESVVDSKAILAGILADLVKVLWMSFFSGKISHLQVTRRQVRWPKIIGKIDQFPVQKKKVPKYLTEPILATITDIDNFNHFSHKPLVEHITLAEFCLKSALPAFTAIVIQVLSVK